MSGCSSRRLTFSSMIVSGVRSSWLASAVNWRWRVNASSSRSSMWSKVSASSPSSSRRLKARRRLRSLAAICWAVAVIAWTGRIARPASQKPPTAAATAPARPLSSSVVARTGELLSRHAAWACRTPDRPPRAAAGQWPCRRGHSQSGLPLLASVSDSSGRIAIEPRVVSVAALAVSDDDSVDAGGGGAAERLDRLPCGESSTPTSLMFSPRVVALIVWRLSVSGRSGVW